MAQCTFCEKILSNRLDVLAQHKLMICKKFDKSKKVISKTWELDVEALATPLTTTQEDMRKFILTSTKLQAAAVLWAKGLISKSVPLRIVLDPHIAQLFEMLGVKKFGDREYITKVIIPQVIFAFP